MIPAILRRRRYSLLWLSALLLLGLLLGWLVSVPAMRIPWGTVVTEVSSGDAWLLLAPGRRSMPMATLLKIEF